ncbi:hypothetical protein M0L04_RS03430 [Citrobacter freundii]|nr:hypothetical protein [Citrobacter freundii]
MTATNKPMTGAQLDELMAVTMRMQSDSEKMGDRSVSMFAYAVQVAVLEIRETRCKYEELQSQNADLAVQLANAESKCRELAVENAGLKKFPDQIVSFIGKLGTSEIGSETKEKIEAAAKKIKTPGTDAFIAEVRAQGVEEFLRGSQLPYQIATVLADYDNVDDATLQTVIWSGQPPEPDGDVWHLEYVSRGNAIVRAVLKELRKGAAL